ncbi:hypothetical protein K2Q02_00835 [Patescibacteria group bacterium]|nr:hypothetical protein [Patescibacteria group bacterium]
MMEGNNFEMPRAISERNTIEQENLQKKAEIVSLIESMGGIDAVKEHVESLSQEQIDELGVGLEEVISVINRAEAALAK